jgi:release factor glutamine methyltransferase
VCASSLRATVVERLRAAGCVAADEEARELVSAAPDGDVLEAWLSRRERGEPLAWITGSVRFGGRPVLVDEGVYVPRIQSEELARRAAARLAASGGPAVDLCTGSGVIAAHLRDEVPSALVVGTDVDRRAAACALRNGIPAVLADLGRGLRSGAFGLVTAVAPYVPTDEMAFLPSDVVRFEPLAALDGGPDGLGVLRRVVSCAARLLRPGGFLLVEVGGEEDEGLAAALEDAGFLSVSSWADEDGDLRGLEARLVRRRRSG